MQLIDVTAQSEANTNKTRAEPKSSKMGFSEVEQVEKLAIASLGEAPNCLQDRQGYKRSV